MTDSFLVLPNMIDKYDLVLTDPPYDLSYGEKSAFHFEFLRLAPAVIVFAPPENQWLLPAEQYLFWVKPTSTKNTSKRYSRFIEMILLYGDLKWNTERHWSQYTNIFTDLVDKSYHPHRKPPSLIERLIRNHTDPGDKILDPFAGSRVVEDVATRLDRYCVSMDILDP